MSEISFVLDGLEHRITGRRLLRDGTDVKLGTRAFDLLECLVRRAGKVVSRQELIGEVWPETIVGDNNLNVQVASLRRQLRPDVVVTVPGRGLTFGGEVLHQRASQAPYQAPSLPDKPSIAVLPFILWSDADEWAFMAEGCVEDVTTELSRFRDLFVVARNSATQFGSGPHDVRDIADKLGVRYVVEGSFRVSGNRVRVTAQLIDAITGAHVWADKFDNELSACFDIQHEIAVAIVTCLVPQLDKAEAERARAQPPESLSAHGIARRAWAYVWDGEMEYDPRPRREAMDLAEAALAMDPRSSLAWRAICWIRWWDAFHETTPDRPQTIAEGLAAADRALALDSTDHHARRLKGLTHFIGRDADEALTQLRRANQINPNCAATLAWLGLLEASHGDPNQSLPFAEQALRLSPLDPVRGSMLCALGFSQFSLKKYADAAAAADESLLESSASASALVLGSIANVGAGDLDKARQCFDRLAETAPKLLEARLGGTWLAMNADYQERAHLFFRIAGGHAAPEAAKPYLESLPTHLA